MFDTDKTDQNNAEKVMLERCEYEKVGVSCIQNIFKPLKLNSFEVMGLVPNENIGTIIVKDMSRLKRNLM